MDNRDEAIVSLMPLVSQIARKLQRQVPQFHLDDLVSEGMIGAIQAVDRYDPEHGVPLRGYAATRIRGQMWDHVRSFGVLSRDHYAEVKEGESEFSLNSLDQAMTSANDDGEVSLIDMLPDDEDAIAKMVDQLAVRAVMEMIPEKHQDLLQAYYYAGMTMKQIGELRGVTESRISQQMDEAHDWAYHYLVA